MKIKITIKYCKDVSSLDDSFLQVSSSETIIYLKSDMNHPWGKEDILVYNIAGILEVSEEPTSCNTSEEITDKITRIPDILAQISSWVSGADIEVYKDDEILKNKFGREPEYKVRDGNCCGVVDSNSNANGPDIFIEDGIEPKDVLKKYVGLYGFISYTLGKYTERPCFNEIEKDSEHFPLILMIFPKKYEIITQKYRILIEIHDPDNKIQGILSKEFIPPSNASNAKKIVNLGDLKDIEIVQKKNIMINKDFNEYINRITRLKQHILNGDIYQANFTMQYSIPWSTAWTKNEQRMFLDLFSQHPAPYAAFLHFPHRNLSIFSISPELFLEIRDGVVITRPIKGTRSRGRNPEEDSKIIEELRNSEKENAELAMIVDLLRNDLARSSIPGSVEVVDHARVESFSNVFHLVSTIQSKTNGGLKQNWNLFLRAFPGGSITGCPKKRAMEIINELEQYSRELYTGCIGYFTIGSKLTMNIAIRTAYTDHHHLKFNSGGGIVIDSDPISEYIECLHKAKHLAKFFGTDFVGHLAWHNGKIISKNLLAQIPFYEKIFESYPFIEGCFETILIEHGSPQNLPQHYERFEKGLHYFNIRKEKEKIPTQEDLALLCKINIANTARLRISCYKIKDTGEIHCIVEIFPYTRDQSEIHLLLASKPFEPPREVKKAGIKTLNYIAYKKSFEEANRKGYWAEILYDHENNILETGKANLYLNIQGEWATPKSNIIEGTYRAKIIQEKGIQLRDIKVEELSHAEEIAVSNALIGFQNVKSIAKGNEKSQTFEKLWAT